MSEIINYCFQNKFEAEVMKWQEKYSAGMTPKIYMIDPVMCCYVMEDLRNFFVLRQALLEYREFPEFAENITDFLVGTLLSFSDIVMDHKEKKTLNSRFSNPELCELTEQLVFTEPYMQSCKHNCVSPKDENFVEQEIYNDLKLKLEVAKLKFEFMNNAQSLIHGGLHTGFIFTNKTCIKVFDPEFAFSVSWALISVIYWQI